MTPAGLAGRPLYEPIAPLLARFSAGLPSLAELDVLSVLDEEGRPDFQALQNAFEEGRGENILYVLFDLPYHEGEDLRDVALEERRVADFRLGRPNRRGVQTEPEGEPEGQRQACLWDDEADEADEVGRERSRKLMGVLDEVNARFGRGAVQLGALGTKPVWTMKRGRVSPRYTTRWEDVPKVGTH